MLTKEERETFDVRQLLDYIDTVDTRVTELERERDEARTGLMLMDASYAKAASDRDRLVAENEALHRERDKWKEQKILWDALIEKMHANARGLRADAESALATERARVKVLEEALRRLWASPSESRVVTTEEVGALVRAALAPSVRLPEGT